MTKLQARKSPAATGLNQNTFSNPDIRSTTDPVQGFLDAIRSAGIAITEPDRIVADGEIARFHIDGDRRGSRNGWSVLFTDAHGAGGAFGHWRTGESHTWRVGRGRITDEERRRVSARIAEAKRLREADRAKVSKAAQKRAQRIWDAADSAMFKHPYLLRKGVNPYDLRQAGDRLLVPLVDVEGVIWSLQFIGPDGTKRFLTGGAKKGHFHQINQIIDRVNICEGLATGLSIYEATGTATVIAFDAGNLIHVAKAIRAKYPRVAICICADNDTGTTGNPGLTAANAAAAAVGGRVAIPPEGCNDFNDAFVAEVAA